ncbi:MAG: glycosyltransferase family 2 protein [Kiritimatiellae bacterium]|nr:glycosyltransferase family 2 protein [Kiritimatiellia bacterium]
MAGMQTPLSIIIPVRNTAQYLCDALHSVARQTFDDFEAICVDDASDDASGAILAEFAADDTRFRTITLPSHSGAGAARNAGLADARGKYAVFLDSDDTFSPYMLETMIAAIDVSCADVGVCVRSPRKCGGGDVFTRYVGWAWDKIFRRDFIERNNLRFPQLPVAEDVPFVMAALALAENIVEIPGVFVEHRMREGSAESLHEKMPLAAFEALRELRGMLDAHGCGVSFTRFAARWTNWLAHNMANAQSKAILLRGIEQYKKAHPSIWWAWYAVKNRLRWMGGAR